MNAKKYKKFHKPKVIKRMQMKIDKTVTKIVTSYYNPLYNHHNYEFN